MHIRLLAVGERQPPWVNDAFGIYSGRFPREWKFRLDTIATVRRKKNDKPLDAVQTEGERILAKLNPTEQVVLLDERGEQLTSKALAQNLFAWQSDGPDLCFVIGGPAGFPEFYSPCADLTWPSSRFTLPHATSRVSLSLPSSPCVLLQSLLPSSSPCGLHVL